MYIYVHQILLHQLGSMQRSHWTCPRFSCDKLNDIIDIRCTKEADPSAVKLRLPINKVEDDAFAFTSVTLKIVAD